MNHFDEDKLVFQAEQEDSTMLEMFIKTQQTNKQNKQNKSKNKNENKTCSSLNLIGWYQEAIAGQAREQK